jgi:hypothetical protein
MHAAAIHASFRGVSCRFCDKPIRLSESFIVRQTAIKRGEATSNEELYSKVFAARCRSCHGEAIYSVGQIYDFSHGERARDEL